MSYCTISHLDISSPLQSVPLIPEGHGGTFSPFLSPDGLTKQVVVANKGGQITLLQQDSVSGAWSKSPFYIPNLDENVVFEAYMTLVSITESDSKPLADKTVLLKSPQGWADILVNGRSLTVGPSGTRVVTDYSGALTLITPTEDLSGWPSTISDPGGGHEILFGSNFEVGPTEKAAKKLKTIKSGNDQRDAKLEVGTKVLDGSRASDEDIDAAASAISQLTHLKPQLERQTVLRTGHASANHRLAFTTGKVRAGTDLGVELAGWNSDQITGSKAIVDLGEVCGINGFATHETHSLTERFPLDSRE